MARPATRSTALWVIRRLREAGFQALLAGGCVRDMLLGLRSYDYDVATDATPHQVRRLFRHVLLVGRDGGFDLVRDGAPGDAPARRGLTADALANGAELP